MLQFSDNSEPLDCHFAHFFILSNLYQIESSFSSISFSNIFFSGLSLLVKLSSDLADSNS